MYAQNNDITYFDSFGVEHIPEEIRTFIGRPSSIKAYDSIMCGCFYIGFIDFILAGKTLTELTNLFSLNNFKKMMM